MGYPSWMTHSLTHSEWPIPGHPPDRSLGRDGASTANGNDGSIGRQGVLDDRSGSDWDFPIETSIYCNLW